MSAVYIVGIDMNTFGRYPDTTVPTLAAVAALGALEDAGLTIRDIQTMYCGCLYRSMAMIGQQVLGLIGQTGIPVINVANACATGATAFRGALTAVESGQCDVALAVGVEQMGKGLLGGGGGLDLEGVLGSQTMPAMFAHIGMEHTRKYGTTFEQFAKVTVKNRAHAVLNPKSFIRKEITVDEVMAAEMIAYPNTKPMCSVNVDGAAAAVLVSEAAVKRLGLMDRAIKVRSSVLTSNPFDERLAAMPDFNGATRIAAAQAYEAAGLGAEDLDLVELHDCFATAEIVHYENLGLCGEGQAGRLIDDGSTRLGGRMPVNVSGGLLSKGHPLGATGLANIFEVATHLRDSAGSRQVEGARIGMTHVVGGGPGMGTACAIHVLQKP